ncbi:protein-export chaperone SecB [Palleronia abyssalis]|uniref:Protein-export protein SecB n=1 Tax=Palleronia abyssalis TaxID=1501240 RepID=A0A2R8BSQ0_9RHOB|nr:protein-export chaperone SecB [Palleronia abyssalis]SPJ23182.1 Protein-export protein SecB [Palleronia abyssalis]
MAETENQTQPAAPNGEQPSMPQIRPLAQFIRDMSFENALAQRSLKGQVQPDVSVQVSLDAKKREGAEDQYEVIGKFTVRSKNKDSEDMLFLLELEYGGIFQVSNVNEQQLHPFLLIEAPRLMFPYIRRIVSDVTHDGGFPPLNLEPIDFVQLYRQGIAQRAQAKQGQPSGTA